MLVLPAAIGTFLLVNLLCACVALGIGFAAGVLFASGKNAKANLKQPPKKTSSKQSEEAKRAAERTAMAASCVADLAQTVATNVGDHAAKMRAISDDLAAVDRGSDNAGAAVFSAMDQILDANTELQQRLEVAEKQLAVQAAEIKAHESEARTDSLTGLSNRRAFDDELKRRLSEWQRKATPCSLILLDVDHFKKFNDTHGHQVGDEVLRQVAKVLTVQCREMDLPCRYGGEEFGIILPATAAAIACKVAERIRVAIEAATTICDNKKLKITCSLGVADFASAESIAILIRRADDALYVSKKAGRNCGHWSTGGQHVPIAAPDTAPVVPVEDATAVEEAEAIAEHPKPAEQLTSLSGATFIQMLKRRVTESHRFGIPISVMYIKIDDYDVVKAKHGIGIARQVVEAAAPAFQKVLREMDTLAKLENGEFVVMLPGSTQHDVKHVLKRMQNAAAGCMLPMLDRQLQIAFHHGIAQLNPSESAQELLARARQAVTAAAPSPQPARA